MRRLLRLLLWLYPPQWRARYGDELHALFDDMEPGWSDVWNVAANGLWVRSTAMSTRKWLVAGAIMGSATHAALVYAHGTGRYESVGSFAAPGAGLLDRITAVSPTAIGDETMRTLLLSNGASEEDIRALRRGDGYAFGVWAGAAPNANGTITVHARARRPEQARAMAHDMMDLIKGRAEPYWKLAPIMAPTLPSSAVPWDLGYAYATRWRLGRLIGLGALGGAGFGLLVVLLTTGWRKFATRS
jgi:hypothetical protein